MLAFCVLAPLGDSLAKLLGDTVPLGVLILVRFGVQAAILLPIVFWSGQTLRLPTGLLGLTLTRTVLHICGIGMMFTSLRYLPLADAIAIAFVMPFIMLILGHFILGEHVGPQRIIACAIGFVGTLLVIQPNFAEVGAPALQAISGLQATAIIVPAMLLLPNLPGLGFSAIASTTLPMLALLGILGTVAHLFMTWSLRFAPSATLAPMQYLEIPIGTVIGWLIFKDLPNGLAAIGICITVAAGLYIIARERRLSRKPTAHAAE